MKREKKQQLAHLVAGLVTLAYGFDTFEPGSFLSAASYLFLAIIFMIVAGSHKWISEKFMKADVAFFLVEAATIIYAGLHYKAQERTFLFYAMAFVALFYFIFAIIALTAKEKTRHRSHRRKRRKRSSLFDEKKSGDDSQSENTIQ